MSKEDDLIAIIKKMQRLQRNELNEKDELLDQMEIGFVCIRGNLIAYKETKDKKCLDNSIELCIHNLKLLE